MKWNLLLIIPGVALLAGYRVRCLRKQNVPTAKALGLSFDGSAAAETAVGVLICVLAMGAVFLVEWWAGLISIAGVGPPGVLARDLITVVGVPFIEEFVNRCAVLGALLLIVRRAWVAVLISAVGFGVMHAGNDHASILSVIHTIIAGLVYGIPFAATERIWLPMGLHMGWNYAQGRIFGFAVSGSGPAIGFSFIQLHDNGPALLTGGAYGPEGGVIGLLGQFAALALVVGWLLFRRRRDGGASHTRESRG